MTKKQKARAKSRFMADKFTADFLNANCRRFRTAEDGNSGKNGIARGEPGYEEAQFEERFVFTA